MKSITFSCEYVIKAEKLVKQVRQGTLELTIINNISLAIRQGETTAVLGVSGSGKTTLLGLLAGMDIPTGGHVLLGGQNLNLLSENARATLRSGNIGFVFQNFQLLPNLSALENVMLPLEFLASKTAREQAEELLGRVGLSARQNHYPAQLSGGEQQRVSIARAFVTEPKVLFADEPTGNLDQTTGEKIIKILFDLNKKFNTTLVMVTHDKSIANSCEKSFTLDNGSIIST